MRERKGAMNCEDCIYSDIADWEQDEKTGKAKAVYWCKKHEKLCENIQDCQNKGMVPEYIGAGNFDTNNYVYARCKCPLTTDYAIKWPRIKDGKPHKYKCTCEYCGTEVEVFVNYWRDKE